MTAQECGLRERKRRATKLAIQRAALRIAIDDGIAAVTVDEISRRADISPRTFFNYFPSKEQALLGEELRLPEQQHIDEYIAGGPSGELLHDTGTLLIRATQEMLDERTLTPDRQTLLRAQPELFSKHMASMRELQSALSGIIERRLLADQSVPADAAASRARLAALVSFATVRHAWGEWSAEHDGDLLIDRIGASFAEVHELVSRSPR